MLKGPERSHHWHKIHMKQLKRRADRAFMRASGTNRTPELSYKDLVSSITPFQRLSWKLQKFGKGLLNKISPKQYARRANQSA